MIWRKIKNISMSHLFYACPTVILAISYTHNSSDCPSVYRIGFIFLSHYKPCFTWALINGISKTQNTCVYYVYYVFRYYYGKIERIRISNICCIHADRELILRFAFEFFSPFFWSKNNIFCSTETIYNLQ